MENVKLEVTYQPLNECWGVLLKHGNITNNVVDKDLKVVLLEMSEFITKYIWQKKKHKH